MQLSIVIPVINESKNLSILLPELIQNAPNAEIIVVDGGSTDDSVEVASSLGAVTIKSPTRGRAAQMNLGANLAKGSVLYFVHADSRPPKTFADDIGKALEKGYPMGCYRFKFDSSKFLLQVNSYFTRFDRLMFRGGDQTLFIQREIFDQLNGFDENFRIMEEYDFLIRARKKYRFKIIPKDVIVSARKYDDNSYFKVNFANLIVFTMFRMGYSQQRMLRTYYRLLRQENYNFGA